MTASTLVDLVKIVVLNTGTGIFSLGAPVETFRGVEALIDGNVYSYSVQQGANWEYGTGTFSVADGTLTRSVLRSSNGGSPIALTPNAVITFTVLAEDLLAVSASAVAEVNAAGAAQVTAVNAAGSTQITAVNAAGTTEIAAVTAEGTTQIAAVEAAAALATGRFASIPALLTGTTNGQFGEVRQALGFADDQYENVSGAALALPGGPNPTAAGVLLTQQITQMTDPTAVTPFPRVPLVSINPAFGKFTDGREVPVSSAAIATTTHNALPSTSIAGNGGSGAVFTPFYTVIGGVVYHRMQLAAHGDVIQFAAFPASHVAGKFLIRSNAGAGAQNVKMGLASALDIYALTEGADTPVAFSKTATGTDNIWFYNDADALPIDALVADPCQLYFQGEAPPATEPSSRFTLAEYNVLRAAGNVLFGDGNSLAPTQGVVDLRDPVGAAVAFAAGSYVIAIRQDGASSDNAAIIFTPTATGINYYTIQAGVEFGNIVARLFGLEYNSGISINGEGWFVLSARSNSTESKILLNGVSVAEGAGASSVNIPYFFAGGGGPSPAGPLVGRSLPLAVDNSWWSDSDMAAFVAACRTNLQNFGDIVPRRNWLISEGDSNWCGPGSDTFTIPDHIANALGVKPCFRSRAAPGSAYANVLARMPLTVKMIEGAVAFGDNVIFDVGIGTNDNPLPTLAQMRVLWAMARDAGAKVGARTIQPRGDMPWGLSAWNASNAAIVGDSANYDALLDVAGLAIVGDPATWGYMASYDPTYVYSDLLHWTDASQTLVVNAAVPVFTPLLV